MNRRVFDPLILFGALLLVLWMLGALVFEGPGWVHALLTAGVFLIIYRIVARGTPAPTRRE